MSTTHARQRTLAELRNMNPEQIAEAHAQGELDELLAGNDPAQLDAAALKGMSPNQINEARREDRLDQLLGIR